MIILVLFIAIVYGAVNKIEPASSLSKDMDVIDEVKFHGYPIGQYKVTT